MNVDPSALSFLDTNLLVYAFDRSAGRKHDLAAELVAGFWEHQNGCLSLQVLQEFYVTVTRNIPAPMDSAAARQVVADLAQWRVHTPQTTDLLHAIDLAREYQVSFWDAQILQSALSLGCKTLLSEDLSHDQQYGEVQVINPFRESTR